MTKHLFTAALSFALFSANASAKTTETAASDSIAIKLRPHVRKFFIGSGLDAGIFSVAALQHQQYAINGDPLGMSNTTYSTLRFSYIINFGLTFNYNFNRHVGVYTGIDMKNIGFIEKLSSGMTRKQRTYNLGVPVGIKIGNMADRRGYIFLGGGIDAPFNYRQKSFVNRSQKTKYNEWFSDATPAIMPYVFAGVAIPRGVSVKFQYYPNNYVNPDYTRNSYQVNYGRTVHLMLLSIGFTSPFGKNHDLVKKRVTDLKTSSM